MGYRDLIPQTFTMSFKVIACLFLVAFQSALGITVRQQILNQYQPSLQRLRNVATTKYQESTAVYSNLVKQLNTNQDRAKNSTLIQIYRIRDIVASARKANTTSTSASSCLKTQETAASRLSTVSLNSCYSSSNVSILSTTKNDFSTLSNVALNTASYCGYLNPLEAQNDSYGKCLADKVPDLNRQINLVEIRIEELTNNILHYNLQCLTSNGGEIMEQIGVISYEVNVCLLNH